MKIITAILLLLALTLGMAVGAEAAPAAPEVPTHTSSQVHDICVVIAHVNGADVLGWYSLHGFGLHWADCCIRFSNGAILLARYLIGWGTIDWIANDPKC